MNWRIRFALLLLVTVWNAMVSAQEVTSPRTYRVQIVTHPGDDEGVIAKGLAATYGGRLESAVDPDHTVLMTIAEPVRELLERDPRVQRLERADDGGTPTVPAPAAHNALVRPSTIGAPRLQANSTATPWTTGAYEYDAAGNITEIGDDRFVYDVYSRIKSGTAAAGTASAVTQQYAYDRWGNLTSLQTGTTTIPLTVDTDTNRLTAVNGTGVSYDAAGQVLQQGSTTYTYDGSGMMTSSGTSNVPSTLYVYAPGDERIASVLVSGNLEISSSWSFRDASGRVLRRFDRQKQSSLWTWVWRQDYIYRQTQMLASENDSSPKIRHYFTDHLGTPRLIADSGGMLVGAHTYFPYGGELTAVGAGLNDNQRFTGHERDASSLDYMHARYYNWGWGRFLSVDPKASWRLSTPQSWNRYSYTLNNPLKYVDPNGQDIVIAVNRHERVVDVTLRLTMEVHRRDGAPVRASEYRAQLQGAANILSGTFKTSGGNTVNVRTTIDAIFTSSGGTDSSRHQLELSGSPASLTNAHSTELGGSTSTMMVTMASPKWFAHEFAHWFNLDDATPPDPESEEETPYMTSLMNNEDEAATDMWYADWLEIFRSYREGELNHGIDKAR